MQRWFPAVSKSKAPGSPVGRQGECPDFPESGCRKHRLQAGTEIGVGAEAYGPMLQGIAKPVNDLSRGCSWQDIVGVVALTAVQAQACISRRR